MVLAGVLRLFYYERLTGKIDEQDGLVFGRLFGADHRHRYFGDDSAGLMRSLCQRQWANQFCPLGQDTSKLLHLCDALIKNL